MSYPIATVHAFIELRALGRSLSDISHQLNIPHSTLGDWNTRYHHNIALQQAIQWDRFEAGSELAREKDLARLILLIQQCQCELDNRPVQSFTNSELMRPSSVAAAISPNTQS